MTKCDVTWCDDAAALEWIRTTAELKKMQGPKTKGVRAQAQPVRRVCAGHCPPWRSENYQPIQTAALIAA